MPNTAHPVVHIKSQSALGTAATITPGTDSALRVFGRPIPAVIGEGVIERADGVSPLGPGLPSVGGSRMWEFELVTEFYAFSDPADATSSPLAPLWNSCGIMTEADPVTWKPSLTAARGTAIGTLVPFTCQIDEPGGNRYVAYDCHALPTAVAESGARVMVTWSVRGRWVDPVASTLSVGTEVYSSDPLPFVSIGVTAGDDAADFTAIQRIEMRTGLAFVDRLDVTDTYGMAAAFIDWAEAPTIAFTADSDDETALDVWNDAFGGNVKALTFTLAHPTDGSCAISLPAGYLRVPTVSGDAFGVYELEVYGTPDGSDNSLILTWND